VTHDELATLDAARAYDLRVRCVSSCAVLAALGGRDVVALDLRIEALTEQSGVPNAWAAGPQPEPSTTRARCRATPVRSANRAAAAAARSSTRPA